VNSHLKNSMNKSKICPICKIEKSTEEFHRYFSKSRNKYRVGNYCKPCANASSNERAKKYYQDNKEKIKHYQSVIRREWKRKDYKKHIDELSDRYVINKLQGDLSGESAQIIRRFPEIIEAKRTKLLTYRIKKKLKNGKK
ncbi:MAG: hypothetical protein PHC38_11335, partial [Weeksellaceae bacterium]|nr:hypothetical protein [Weeksellaceae bacterium]